MAEIEITLPTVQYGNVKVRATPEELGLKSLAEAYDVGVASAVYLNVFTQGFKKGATLDVAPPQGASQGVSEAQAQRYLDEGLGGVTEVENEESPTDQAGAPWDRPQVDAKPKPWENGEAPAKPVVSEEW